MKQAGVHGRERTSEIGGHRALTLGIAAPAAGIAAIGFKGNAQCCRSGGAVVPAHPDEDWAAARRTAHGLLKQLRLVRRTARLATVVIASDPERVVARRGLVENH